MFWFFLCLLLLLLHPGTFRVWLLFLAAAGT
jgi:hypothetical protein